MDQRNQPHGVDPLRAKRMKIEEPFDTKILPNEVWLEIFSYLSAYDVVNSLAKVCNHFNLLTQDLELIRKVLTKGCCINNLLHFLNLPLDEEGLKELTGITLLKFKRKKDCINIINTALQLCPDLMSIEIKWSPAKCPSDISNEDMKHMIRCVFFYDSVYIIGLNFNRYSNLYLTYYFSDMVKILNIWS